MELSPTQQREKVGEQLVHLSALFESLCIDLYLAQPPDVLNFILERLGDGESPVQPREPWSDGEEYLRRVCLGVNVRLLITALPSREQSCRLLFAELAARCCQQRVNSISFSGDSEDAECLLQVALNELRPALAHMLQDERGRRDRLCAGSFVRDGVNQLEFFYLHRWRCCFLVGTARRSRIRSRREGAVAAGRA